MRVSKVARTAVAVSLAAAGLGLWAVASALGGPVQATVLVPVERVAESTTAPVEQIPSFSAAAKASDLLVSERPSTDAFTILSAGEPTFAGGLMMWKQTDAVMKRALAAVGNAENICTDGQCLNLCDHVAGDIWGYTEASGYNSAAEHWQVAVDSGIAHKGDREPPLGALLFWQTKGVLGHVAVYVGNGQVVSNAVGSAGANVYLVDADLYERQSGFTYLGWADPVFHGEPVGERV